MLTRAIDRRCNKNSTLALQEPLSRAQNKTEEVGSGGKGIEWTGLDCAPNKHAPLTNDHWGIPAHPDSSTFGDNMTVGASGRLFRAYDTYCKESGPDTLFQVLTAMHSLSDQLKTKTGEDFHSIQEFVALKPLRNYIHHGSDIPANYCVIPTPGHSDVFTMCLLRRDQVEYAIEKVRGEKNRDEARAACEAMFHWYGPAVNINPCMFNALVKIYELLVQLEQPLPTADVAELEASYRHEEEYGYSHYVDGRLSATAGSIEGILSDVVARLPTPG